MYKILIADDEPHVVSLLQDYFELNQYQVITAHSGVEAVEASAKKPDIILLDINMPEMDGIEVCRRIRSYVTWPILFLTARIEDADKITGFAAGADDYMFSMVYYFINYFERERLGVFYLFSMSAEMNISKLWLLEGSAVLLGVTFWYMKTVRKVN